MENNRRKNLVENNSDFLFIYEAIQCNPNGDPDQENKPRMDYDTKTNLVTDTRIKRYIRDYLKSKGTPIFIDMEGTSQVSVDTRLLNIIYNLLDDDIFKKNILKNEKIKNLWDGFKKEIPIENNSNRDFYKGLMDIYKKPKKNLKDNLKDFKSKVENELPDFNDELLFWITKNEYIDIRMFGSAVAVSGFPRTVTGAIQLNWGYSLNKVELIDSNSIVTIMNDGSSTFGKDYRLYYSLLAFNGTINKYAAKTTGLNNEDLVTFRDSIWNSVSALPTRSKLNQYPKLYIEIIYNDGFNNGHFGDLRNYIKAESIEKLEDKQVRKFKDLIFDFNELKILIENNKGKGKPIKEIIIKTSSDINF